MYEKVQKCLDNAQYHVLDTKNRGGETEYSEYKFPPLGAQQPPQPG